MASIKIVLKKDKKKDGSYPLAIRVSKDRTTHFVLVGHSVKQDQWDPAACKVKKNHPNSTRLNILLSSKFTEASNKLLELEEQKNDISSRAIQNTIKSAKEGTFFKQAEIYINNLKTAGKFNRKSADEPRINRFKEFLRDADITFAEITTALLSKFKAYLKGTRNVSERTIVNHLVVIRTIFNQAIASNIVDRKHYPFGKGKIVIKFPDSLKIGLTEAEVKALEELELPGDSPLNHSRNLWLFSFYFAGMRISDVLRLRWSDFQNDRLYYSMGKNDKGGSLTIPEKAQNILKQYRIRINKHNLVFKDLTTLPDLNDQYAVQRRINQRVKKINDCLKKVAEMALISKPLTSHIARHTFGNISGNKIPIQMLQKLYRHTSITTTIGYQASFIHKDADEALNAVIGF